MQLDHVVVEQLVVPVHLLALELGGAPHPRELEPVGKNLAEFSDTVKTQPWRLVYPTTKKYPEKSATPSEATITVRKTAKPKASATPKTSVGSR